MGLGTTNKKRAIRKRASRNRTGPASRGRGLPACLLLMLMAISPARGQCALHDVPALLPMEATTRLGLAWRETALAAVPGSLSEAEVSAVFAAGTHWGWAWRWPFAWLSVPAGMAAGLGDPAWELNFRSRAGAWAWGASGFVSAPLGDAGNGLGADAFGGAAFLSAAWMGNAGTLGAVAGLHGMLASGAHGSGHAHAAGAVPLSGAYAVAHPHADREFVYRLQWEGKWLWGLGLAMDGAHVLGTAMGVSGTDFVEGEASLRFAFVGAVWKPSLRVPLSPDRRLVLEAGLAVTRDW
jgi:hypothetical protein